MLSVPTLFGSIGKKAKRKSSDFGIPACWNREFVIECSSVDNDGANGRGTIALFGTLGIGEILLNDPPPISGYPVAADRVGIADDRVERRRGGRERFYEQAVGPDVPGIARFVLGRYWRSASEQEQQEYLKLFEDYVVFVYGTRLSSFNGETFKVRGSRTDDSGTIVSTDIISPKGEAPIKVDWRLITDHGSFRINDVIIEGISMLVTQRSEFASVIQRHGGHVGELLVMMRERTKTASAAQ